MEKTTPPTLWVCYYRVSTQRQGMSGLGLDAQRAAVGQFLRERGGTILAEVTETESGKKASNRPELQRALELCRKHRATLCIAKLDRLVLHLQAAFAEEEGRRISLRTKEALAAAKRRGIVIGATGAARAQGYKADAKEKAQGDWPAVREIWAAGITTLRGLRDELNRRAVPSPGGGRWHQPNTSRLLSRLRVRRPATAKRDTP